MNLPISSDVYHLAYREILYIAPSNFTWCLMSFSISQYALMATLPSYVQIGDCHDESIDEHEDKTCKPK